MAEMIVFLAQADTEDAAFNNKYRSLSDSVVV